MTTVPWGYTAGANAPYFIDERHDVVLRRRVAHDAGAQGERAAQDGPGQEGYAAALYLFHDSLVERVEAFFVILPRRGGIAKQHDGELDRGHKLQVRRVRDEIRQAPRQPVVTGDHG